MRGVLEQANVTRENASPDEREEGEGQKEQVNDAESQALRFIRVSELSTTEPSGG